MNLDRKQWVMIQWYNISPTNYINSIKKGSTAVVVILFLLLISFHPALAQQKTISKEISIEQRDRYLNLPVNGWSYEDLDREKALMRIVYDGETVNEFAMNLALGKPDWWAFFNVEQYQGKSLTIEVDDPARTSGLDKIVAEAEIKNRDELYKEKYRQQVHFSTKRGFINDPNGMIYYNGEWHLYYQYNPYGWFHDNKHWGHAVSKDLVHWEELPIALYNKKYEIQAWSGGATVAPRNSTGFRRDGVDPIIATYTREHLDSDDPRSSEHIALSYDNGRTFEEYQGNPVLRHIGRDPKVIWYEPGNHWVMIVYDTSHFRELGAGQQARLYETAIYTSKNMKDWTYQSGITGMYECPELFELSVEGENYTKWVTYDATGEYYVGDFNGKKFTIEQGLQEYDRWGAFYASQTFSNVPEEDGRRIQMAWFQTSTPDMPFNQSMTFPAELKLRKVDGNYVLAPTPVQEIQKLYTKSYQTEDVVLRNDTTFTSPLVGDQLHIEAEIDLGDAMSVGLNINGFRIVANQYISSYILAGPEGEDLDINKTYYPIHNNSVKIEVIVDNVGMELYIDDGALYYAIDHKSVNNDKKLEIFSQKGYSDFETTTLLKDLKVYELESIWKNQKR